MVQIFIYFHLFSKEEFKTNLVNYLRDLIIERCCIRKDSEGKLSNTNDTESQLYIFLPSIINKKK